MKVSVHIGEVFVIWVVVLKCIYGCDKKETGEFPASTISMVGGASRKEGDNHKSRASHSTIEDRTSIMAYLSLGELLITDPQGRRTGYEPKTARSYANIPGSSYDTIGHFNALTRRPSTRLSKVLHIPRPISGEYVLYIASTSEGAYTLEIFGYDRERNETKAIFVDVPISSGQVHTYNLSYKKEVGSAIKVVGTYGGRGQRRGLSVPVKREE